MDSRYNKYLRLAENTYFKRLGKVVKIVGLTIESVGPDAKLNDLCRIIIDENANTVVMAEVVGFRDKRLLLMPYESVEGIGVGCIVENTGHPLSVPVGNELLGHTLDGIGRPTDIDKLETPYEYPVDAQPPDPMSRKIISGASSRRESGRRIDHSRKRTAYRNFCRFRCRKKYTAWYVCKKYKSRYQCHCPDR